MPAAVPIAVGALGAGAAIKQGNDAKKAAGIQARGAEAGVAEQARQFDRSLEITLPQRIVGNQATNAAAGLLGLPGFNPALTSGNPLPPQTSLVGDTELPIEGRRIVPRNGSRTTYDVFYGDVDVGDLVRGGRNGRFIANGAPIPQPAPQMLEGAQMPMPVQAADSNGNALAAFLESPDYEFRRSEGNRDIQGSFAARGGAQSGNALRALSEFNSNLASGEFGNRFNRLAALAGFGQAANSQGAQNAIQTGRGIASGLQDASSARASGVAGQSQAFGDAAGAIAGSIPLFQDAFGQRNAMRRLSPLMIEQIFAPRAG